MTAPLEEWHFDKETLKRLQRKDPVGVGYTLFLPWGSYRPDLKQVQLRMRFKPPNAYPLYADSAPLTFKDDFKITTNVVQRVVRPTGQEIQQTKGN